MSFAYNFLWSDANRTASMLLRKTRSDPRGRWMASRHFVTRRYVHGTVGERWESLSVFERDAGAPYLNLQFTGRWRIDEIRWRQVTPAELPDVGKYLAACDRIPPAKRTGRFVLPGPGAPETGEPVIVEFQNRRDPR
jgi:hypothetical protein